VGCACRSRSDSADGDLRHLQRRSDAVGTLEALPACDLRAAADEDDIAQVVESVGGPPRRLRFTER
jgi:hypothetical protein